MLGRGWLGFGPSLSSAGQRKHPESTNSDILFLHKGCYTGVFCSKIKLSLGLYVAPHRGSCARAAVKCKEKRKAERGRKRQLECQTSADLEKGVTVAFTLPRKENESVNPLCLFSLSIIYKEFL